MRFPNWFRVLWWITLQFMLGAYLYARWPDLASGHASAADVVVFLVLVILALAPIYEDVALLGVRMRQHIRRVEEEVSGLRLEFKNAVDVHNNFAPTISLSPALSPEKLDALVDEVRRRVTADGLKPEPQQRLTELSVPTQMFKIRYELEQELRRIYLGRFGSEEVDRVPSVSKIARVLLDNELVDRDAAVAIEELYRITSRYIHGVDVLPVQTKFAFDVHGWLLAELRAIR